MYETERKVTQAGVKKGRLIPKDAVLVTCIGATIGKSALAHENCITNQQINAIICNEGIDPHYVYYAITFRDRELRNWAGSAAKPIIRKSLFENFPISIPRSFDEQQKISSVLSTIDESIQKTNEIITKTQMLKKGIMQRILNKGIGHTKFRKTEIGEMPEEWEVVKLGKIISLEYGKGLPERKRKPGPYPVYGSNGIVGYHDEPLVKGPGIIVGRKGTISGVVWSEKDFWPIDTTYYVKIVRSDIVLRWVYYKLTLLRLEKLNMATGVPGLNRNLVYVIPTSLPPKNEQEKIASILSVIDNKIEKEKQTKMELEKTKKWFMQNLLTGKIRLKVK